MVYTDDADDDAEFKVWVPSFPSLSKLETAAWALAPITLWIVIFRFVLFLYGRGGSPKGYVPDHGDLPLNVRRRHRTPDKRYAFYRKWYFPEWGVEY